MAYYRLAISSLAVGLVLMTSPTASADSLNPTTVTLNNRSIALALLDTWYGSLLDKTVSESDHKFTAIRLYSLTFQIWLCSKTPEGRELLNGIRVRNVVVQTARYVDRNDPMVLDHLYANNLLTEEGEEKLGLSWINNGLDALKRKEDHKQLVSKFLVWANSKD